MSDGIAIVAMAVVAVLLPAGTDPKAPPCILHLDLDVTVQRHGVEAFNDLMVKHGRKTEIESAWD